MSKQWRRYCANWLDKPHRTAVTVIRFMRVLITGACGVTSRSVARALLASTRLPDLKLLGTDICDNPYGLYEGLYERVWRAPRVTADGYGEWMATLCRQEKVDAAIVIPELEVVYWSARSFPVPALLPPPEFCRIAVSKKRLYESLRCLALVPAFSICNRDTLLDGNSTSTHLPFPCWMRDFSEGGSSGKGALLAHDACEMRAWAVLNPHIEAFMLSEYLPGRNFACHLLYDRGTIVKIACYVRLEYFMARTAVSGVTGNISRGRLMNDSRLPKVSHAAVTALVESTSETMHGLVAVDMREDRNGRPLVTEINLRHVAATSAFATAGFNLAESHLLLTLGRRDDHGAVEATFPEHNILFRDIDGLPVWLPDYRPLDIGESIATVTQRPGPASVLQSRRGSTWSR